MIRSFFIIIIFLFRFSLLFAQEPTANFNVKSTACANEFLEINNTSSNAESYEWDFCLNDIHNYKESNEIVTLPGLTSGTNYKLIELDGQWLAFVTSYDQNKIYRLNYGASLQNTPSVTDMGNFAGLIVEPYTIDIGLNNGQWYGFVGSLQQGYGLIKLSFGSSLDSTPVASNIGNFGFSTNYIDLQIISQGEDALLALIANGVVVGGDGSMITINFKNSFDNTPLLSDIYNTPIVGGATSLRGFHLLRKDSNWVGVYTSTAGNKIITIKYPSNIQAPPVQTISYSLSGINIPFDVSIVQEGDNFYGVVANLSQSISLIDFYDLSLTLTPAELSSFSLPTLFSLNAFRYKGKTLIHGAALNNKVQQIIFEAPCEASLDFSVEKTPLVNFKSSSTNEIELVAINSNYQKSVISKTVNILNLSSPDISVISNGVMCTDVDVEFITQNISGDINTYSWDFGDGNFGAGATTQHAYTSGSYIAHLAVSALNGCDNFLKIPIKIYDEPVSQFDLPDGTICTNNVFTFINETEDVYDGNLSYQWYINNTLVSTLGNLEYVFGSTGAKDVKLVASIPGCSNETIQTIPQVFSGPTVEFSFTGQCEGEVLHFTNGTVGDVENYSWSFGDGKTSSAVNTQNIFNDAGNFTVSLTATNAVGCNNSKAKIVKVYTQPQVDFSTAPAPLSCSGSPAQFLDATLDPADSDITSWLWTFNDAAQGTSTIQSPQYTFDKPGDYNVSLAVASDKGCSNITQKVVTIQASPVVDFNFTATCQDVPVVFTPSGASDLKSLYWELEGTNYFISNPSHTFTSPGNYDVNFFAIGTNNCITTITKTISIPEPLEPAFSVIQNCIDQPAVFTDITTGVDQVVQQMWNFNGMATSSGTPTSYTFDSLGPKAVTLTVASQAGCSYSITNTIDVLNPPTAMFEVTPSVGAIPLKSQFENLSSGATSYLWNFGVDNATSSDVNPAFTFEKLGDFEVTLTAFNDQRCEAYSTKVIKTVAPLPNVNLKIMTLKENVDGTIDVIITVENKGNTYIENLPVKIELSGNASLQEIIEGPLAPSSMFNLVLEYGIAKDSRLQYLCANALLTNDLDLTDNRICSDVQDEISILSAYPNPVDNLLYIEWISDKSKNVTISLLDILGKEVFRMDYNSDEGLNQKILNVEQFGSGIYLLIFDTNTKQHVQRIMISE